MDLHSTPSKESMEPFADTSSPFEANDPSPSLISPSPPPASRQKKILTALGWSFAGIALLTFFTLLKLPDDRIHRWTQGQIASALAPRGIQFQFESGGLRLGWGLRYDMDQIRLGVPEADEVFRFNQISVRPSLLDWIWKKPTARYWIKQDPGEIKGVAGIGIGSSPGGPQWFKFLGELQQLDLGKTGFFLASTGVRGSIPLSGDIDFEGDLNLPSSIQGEMNIKLAPSLLPAQTLAGFQVPSIQWSEGQIQMSSSGGKIKITSIKLGKPGSNRDDLIAQASGDILLGKTWASSSLNLQVNVKFSEPLLKAFILIDALWASGKQSDGSYQIAITGSPLGPQVAPVAKK